jgi:hypothetical protein
VKRASDILYLEYKQKSFNNPFFSPPTQHEIFEKARDLFLEENSLEINNCGLFVNSGPYEPNEPNEPSEPSDLSEIYLNTKVHLVDFDDAKTETNIDFLIENKIKKLLEMTETETTQTS